MKRKSSNGAITRRELWRLVEPIYEPVIQRATKILDLDFDDEVREALHTVLVRMGVHPTELADWPQYLTRCAINEIRHDHADKRELSFSELWNDERRRLFEERRGPWRDPWEIAAQRELVAMAMAELQKLPAQQRAVLTLWINDYSTKEIAVALGQPAATVRSNLRHGLKTLRRRFKVTS